MHFEQAKPSDETGKPLTKKWSLATNDYGGAIEQDLKNKVLYPLIDQLKLKAETVIELVDGYFC